MKHLTKANLLTFFAVFIKIMFLGVCLIVAYNIYADNGISTSGLLLM